MSNVPDFLVPDEDDYAEAAASSDAVREDTSPTRAFGESGYRKGQTNPRRGTPRARITELDARLLYFIGHFPGADTEALSVLNTAQPTSFGTTAAASHR